MRRRSAASALAAALLVATAAPAHAEDPVSVELDKSTLSMRIGDRFSFSSTVRAPEGARDLVAHLNIVGLDPEVYVDPEDWSDERTQYVDELRAGEARKLSWSVQAVNDGDFLVYVAVATPGAGGPVVAGPALRAEVEAQRTINAGGILPIAAAVPGVLLALTLAARLRARRLR
jgi:hypothetical protein